MQLTRFGRTGMSVSRLCLGTATFGKQCEREALSMNKEKRHPQEGQHSADAIAAGPGTECSRETG